MYCLEEASALQYWDNNFEVFSRCEQVEEVEEEEEEEELLPWQNALRSILIFISRGIWSQMRRISYGRWYQVPGTSINIVAPGRLKLRLYLDRFEN
jgi:hypothetical protein